jgi:hypothetical protein
MAKGNSGGSRSDKAKSRETLETLEKIMSERDRLPSAVVAALDIAILALENDLGLRNPGSGDAHRS